MAANGWGKSMAAPDIPGAAAQRSILVWVRLTRRKPWKWRSSGEIARERFIRAPRNWLLAGIRSGCRAGTVSRAFRKSGVAYESQGLQYDAPVLSEKQSEPAPIRALVLHHAHDRLERPRAYRVGFRAIVGHALDGGPDGHRRFDRFGLLGRPHQQPPTALHRKCGQFSELSARLPDSRICHRHVALRERAALAGDFRRRPGHWLEVDFPRSGGQWAYSARFQSFEFRSRDDAPALPRGRFRAPIPFH